MLKSGDVERSGLVARLYRSTCRERKKTLDIYTMDIYTSDISR
jgi:hypothetical protein